MTRPSPGFVALFAAALLAAVSAAFGQTVYESFSYSSGALLSGESGGTGFSAGWTDSHGFTIHSASPLTVSGWSGTGNYLDITAAQNVSRALGSSLAGDTWISFLLQPDSGTLTYGGLTVGFGDASLNGNHTGTNTGMFVGFSGATFGVGTNGGGGLTISGGTAAIGTAQFLVVDFNFADATSGTVTLYVNATPTGTLGSAAGSAPFTLATSDVIGFGAGGNGASFDELRIGNSFAAVTPIPEPAGVAAGLALCALGAVGVREHRRRRQLAAT